MMKQFPYCKVKDIRLARAPICMGKEWAWAIGFRNLSLTREQSIFLSPPVPFFPPLKVQICTDKLMILFTCEWMFPGLYFLLRYGPHMGFWLYTFLLVPTLHITWAQSRSLLLWVLSSLGCWEISTYCSLWFSVFFVPNPQGFASFSFGLSCLYMKTLIYFIQHF